MRQSPFVLLSTCQFSFVLSSSCYCFPARISCLLVLSLPFSQMYFPGTCSSSTPADPPPLTQPLSARPGFHSRLPAIPARRYPTSLSCCGSSSLCVVTASADCWELSNDKIFLHVLFNWLLGQAYTGETLVTLVQIFWKQMLSSLNLIPSALVFLTDSFLKHQVVA